MSLSARGLSRSRGASVLAALVLVGILGVAYVAFQYAQSSFHLAEGTPMTLTAAAAITTPSAGSFTGCTRNSDRNSPDYGKLTCQCAQPARSPKAVNGSLSTVQNCLPGCVYDVHPGTSSLDGDVVSASVAAPKIVTESSPSMSLPFTGTPDSSLCKVKVCTSSDASSCVLAGSSKAPISGGNAGAGAGPDSQTSPVTSPTAGNADTSGEIASALGNCNTDPALGLPCPSTNTPTPPGADSPTNMPSDAINTPTPPGADSPTSAAPCTYSTPSIPCVEGVVQNPDLSSSVSGPNSANPCASNEVTINGTCQEAPPGVSTSCASGEVLVAGNCQTPPPNLSTSCASGEVLVAGSCQSSPSTFTQTPAAPKAPPANPAAAVAAALNNAAGDVNQFLGGLLKGLASGLKSGSGSSASPSAPYGVGTNGAACYQPPVQPDPSTCSVGTWQSTSSSGNGCVTGWQCVPSNTAATQPTATLSCQPQTADVGMTVSISYSCANATGSSGVGFDTQNALSGSTSTVIATPPTGANTASYGVTCINGTQTASQQCAIQINKPWISLAAIPSVVTQNGSSTIGWVTGGMQSCTLFTWDPLEATPTVVTTGLSGVTTLFSIATTTPVSLLCQTTSGGTKQADTGITIH